MLKCEKATTITNINVVAVAIDNGNFALEPLTSVTQRTDELGQLARTFQHMAEQVREREQRL